MNMRKEYIEREAAYNTLTGYYHHSTDIQHEALREALGRVPAADVVPVRHGRWKPHSKVEMPIFHCSVCGGATLHAFGKQCKSDYCPNCGARMDGDGARIEFVETDNYRGVIVCGALMDKDGDKDGN